MDISIFNAISTIDISNLVLSIMALFVYVGGFCFMTILTSLMVEADYETLHEQINTEFIKENEVIILPKSSKILDMSEYDVPGRIIEIVDFIKDEIKMNERIDNENDYLLAMHLMDQKEAA